MSEPNTVFICEPHLKLITGAHNVFHTDGSIHSPAAQTQVLKWSFASHAYSMLGRFILVRRVCLIVGLLYGYRALTMIITVLPAANPEYLCDPQLNHTISAGEVAHRVVKIISGFGLSINGQHVYCGDWIFSGHTMILILAYLIVAEYSPRYDIDMTLLWQWPLECWYDERTWINPTILIFMIFILPVEY